MLKSISQLGKNYFNQVNVAFEATEPICMQIGVFSSNNVNKYTLYI